MLKFCNKCNTEKSILDFYKNKNTKDGYTCFCKKCLTLQSKKWKEKNREYNKEYCKIYNDKNKEKLHEMKNKNYHKNKDYYKEQHKKWCNENKDKINIYVRGRYTTDMLYRIPFILRERIRAALKNNQKKGNTIKLLGCSVEFLKLHLQQTAINNGYLDFDINNYSGKEYHIDHIIPCAAFNLRCGYHQKLCFHWSNLQILEAELNMIKHDRLAA